MSYEERIVCYFDILGFKEHIEKTINQDKTENSIQSIKIEGVIRLIQNIIKVRQKADKILHDVSVTMFSDTVIISFPTIKTINIFPVLSTVKEIIIRMISQKILFRGAIVCGKLRHLENIIFDPALIDGYILETKAALYPRIIFGTKVLELKLRPEYKIDDREIKVFKDNIY